MPITTSAKKALRASQRKKIFNDRRKRDMRAAVKAPLAFLKEGNRDKARALLPNAYKAIDKAAKRGVIKKNAAARKKSRLALLVNKKS